MARGRPPDSILHARRHSSQQVCRHRITGQQLSEHPAADTVLVPLTRSVYKPATRILSLQSEIEKQRNNPQDKNCPPTNPPTGPDSTSHLIQNITKQRRKLQQHYAFRGTLDSFTQSEGGPVFEQRWIDGKMNGWTRGCQDKERV